MRTHTLVLGFALAAASPSFVLRQERPSESFRAEHRSIREHLRHVEEVVGSLAEAPGAERKGRMSEAVAFFREHIVPHAEAEERGLYPAVDKRAGSAVPPFTASMRHEHRIVGRWVEELAAEAGKPSPDARTFCRRADNLLGLLAAHFEEEEEVLLPILDRTLTKEEFEKEVGGPVRRP
ncbi:MAG: hemerythrin domain-containing protein [Planctomycetes bacterium]|nr:hemerythrin domain-containing protein [Planctomycetota bacterium]